MKIRKRTGLIVAAILAVGLVAAMPAIMSHVDAGAPIAGAFDFAHAKAMGLDFTQPASLVQPKLTKEQVQAALSNMPEFQKASEVRYQFLLLTTSINAYAPDAVQADPTLATDLKTAGHPVDLPVWLVSLEGLTIPATQGPAVNHEDNLVVDANTGQVLLTFTYR